MKILKAVLGWANPETHGGNSLRLYALDKGDSPRWAPFGGRTVEQAIIEHYGKQLEGDRYLVVHLGDRFVKDDVVVRIIDAIQGALEQTSEAGCATCNGLWLNFEDGVWVRTRETVEKVCQACGKDYSK